MKSNTIRFVKLSVDTHKLEQSIIAYSEEIQNQLIFKRFGKVEKLPFDPEPYSSDLYDWLIRPVINVLSDEIDTLVIIPDSILRTIPFAAFTDREDNYSYLIEQYALAYLPSIELTEAKGACLPGTQSLLAGISEKDDFRSLPNVPNELKTIKQTIGGKILLNKFFTIKQLKKQ
ncbi:MAG: hypothetical protein OMM_09152 [Candidatus Magnetoglobus multicellularis str. Araruama]|uniref:CHAT domain-containing protein n=1 Tax=Candidatus Magnetoglobus multicellularis str. Araruama TaxID=890399 RepID=A0A1V1P588_9BACT|nr:MAG: hypothetical protein OMM_09152 [Candidatus Magnetoglobus multicellularis str. Araruama]